jgi:hypothetical protein
MGAVGQWRSTSTGQIRKAQERLRIQIESGAYPMLITPQANMISDLPGHYLVVNPDGAGAVADTADALVRVFGPRTEAGEPGGGDLTILQVVKSKPGRQGLGNSGSLVDKNVEATLVKLVLRGKSQVFSNTIKWNQNLYIVEQGGSVAPTSFNTSSAFSFAGGASNETLLANDVNEVQVSVDKAALGGGSTSARPVAVEVKLRCIEPSQGQAETESTVRAQPNSGVDVK